MTVQTQILQQVAAGSVQKSYMTPKTANVFTSDAQDVRSASNTLRLSERGNMVFDLRTEVGDSSGPKSQKLNCQVKPSSDISISPFVS